MAVEGTKHLEPQTQPVPLANRRNYLKAFSESTLAVTVSRFALASLLANDVDASDFLAVHISLFSSILNHL
ncbi:MAG TPA: hypothetical protein VE263_14705 [Candidatus Angelobacter sp.]|nr:hypothetical protein [Candidatus Angelobacter sp.]